jgi:hypothetical protein
MTDLALFWSCSRPQSGSGPSEGRRPQDGSRIIRVEVGVRLQHVTQDREIVAAFRQMAGDKDGVRVFLHRDAERHSTHRRRRPRPERSALTPSRSPGQNPAHRIPWCQCHTKPRSARDTFRKASASHRIVLPSPRHDHGACDSNLIHRRHPTIHLSRRTCIRVRTDADGSSPTYGHVPQLSPGGGSGLINLETPPPFGHAPARRSSRSLRCTALSRPYRQRLWIS